MKILVISDLYPPHFVGGYEINCMDTVDAFRDRGHQVTVLTSTWGSNETTGENQILRQLMYDPALLNQQDQNPRMKNVYLELFRSDFRRIWIARQNYHITRRIIAEIQPDIVYFWHLACTTTSPITCVSDLDIPYCIRIEDYSYALLKISFDQKKRSLRKQYKSLVLKLSEFWHLEKSHLVVNSQVVKDTYIEAGYPDKAIVVIYDGLPEILLRHPNLRPHPPFANPTKAIELCFVGRICPEKGPDIAMNAVALLRSELPEVEVRLSLAGTGPEEYLQELYRLVNDLGIKDRVFFLGKQPQDKVLRYYQEFDGLLFTSRWQEPLSRVVMEAMSQGLPIVAARSGGTVEIISDQENGLLVPKEDPQALCEGVKRLLTAPDFASEISRNAYETIVSRFTIEQTAAQTELILDRAISAKKGSSSLPQKTTD